MATRIRQIRQSALTIPCETVSFVVRVASGEAQGEREMR
jgi:hypothetical protein